MRIIFIKNGYNLKPKYVMNRKEVYENLDIERDYQDIKVQTRRVEQNDVPDTDKSVAEWVNYMEYHLGVAKNMISQLNTSGALGEIRKVTALGVRTMEIHGCPKRIMPEKD